MNNIFTSPSNLREYKQNLSHANKARTYVTIHEHKTRYSHITIGLFENNNIYQ